MLYHLKQKAYDVTGTLVTESIPLAIKLAPMFTAHCSECDLTFYDHMTGRTIYLTLIELDDLEYVAHQIWGSSWRVGENGRALTCNGCAVNLKNGERAA